METKQQIYIQLMEQRRNQKGKLSSVFVLNRNRKKLKFVPPKFAIKIMILAFTICNQKNKGKLNTKQVEEGGEEINIRAEITN